VGKWVRATNYTDQQPWRGEEYRDVRERSKLVEWNMNEEEKRGQEGRNFTE
jgi:hypothetical protein